MFFVFPNNIVKYFEKSFVSSNLHITFALNKQKGMAKKLSKKRYEFLIFREGVIEKIKSNTALCDLLMAKLKTDNFGLYRMIRDNSQSLMNYAILKDISKQLSLKIENLVEEKIVETHEI